MKHSPDKEVRDLKIEFGMPVIDINGKQLGTVDNIIRDSWSGEIKKFVVKGKTLGTNLFLSIDDISAINEDRINLKSQPEEPNRHQG